MAFPALDLGNRTGSMIVKKYIYISIVFCISLICYGCAWNEGWQETESSRKAGSYAGGDVIWIGRSLKYIMILVYSNIKQIWVSRHWWKV